MLLVRYNIINGIRRFRADTNSTQTITGTKTFFNTPLFQSGIVSQANCSFANNSIQLSAISGGVGASLSSANTWSAIQTFSQPPVLSGASITTNTIPPSAIVGGGIVLPATTMTARTARTATQNTTFTATALSTNQPYDIVNIGPLSPVGSVWIVNINMQFQGLSSNANGLIWGVQFTNDVTWNPNNQQPAFNAILGYNHGPLYLSSGVQTWSESFHLLVKII